MPKLPWHLIENKEEHGRVINLQVVSTQTIQHYIGGQEMNIIDRGISSSKSIDSGITAKIFERFKKSLLSSTAAIGVLAVCSVVLSNAAYAVDTVFVGLEIDQTNGKVLNVFMKDRQQGHEQQYTKAVKHGGEGLPGGHGPHIGEPIPITIILGMKGAASTSDQDPGPTSPCPSGSTHIIVGGIHYCI